MCPLEQGFNEDNSGNTVVSGTVTANVGTTNGLALDSTITTLSGKFGSLGQKAMAGSAPVVIASDQTAIPVTSGTSGTATLTTVAASASSVAMLASNASRKGFAVYNDSTSVAFLAMGATASATVFTAKLQPNSYFENPSPTFTGAINIIWSSATGNARITEYT